MDVMLAITVPLAGVITTWIAYRKEVAVARWQTVRMTIAVNGVPAEHLPAVITACANFEQPGKHSN